MNDHYGKLERMYLAANIHRHVYPSTTISINEDFVTISLEVDSRLHHAAGAMHGSVYFKLLDDAAYFAVSAQVMDVFVLTKSFSVDLKRPFQQGKITAIGQVIKVDEDQFIASSVLKNPEGKILAEGHGIFVKGPTALSADIGYE